MKSPEELYDEACAADSAGKEALAIPLYKAALAGGLPQEKKAKALLGLGSSLRNIGAYPESIQVLRDGYREFPQDHALPAFLALSLPRSGRTNAALATLLPPYPGHVQTAE